MEPEATSSIPTEPKRITNAQTVCNEINAKGKSCNGFLKQTTIGENAKKHLRGDDALFRCQFCGRIYVGPPMGHLRDPATQQKFIQKELTDLLEAAGGTMPVIVQNERGVYTLAQDAEAHAALTEKTDQSKNG